MCNCASTPNTSCSNCNTSCVGCQYTMNTDCVIFNKEKLEFEAGSVTDNSSRTLTSVLQAVENNQILMESEFHTIGDGSFTLDPNSNNKLINLVDFEGTISLNAIITLPLGSLDYANKVYTFINKTPITSGAWSFNTPITVDYDPFTTQIAYNTICPSGTKILKITFIQVSPVSWGWIVLQN